ncbi:MAG: glycosyltransferase family 2 protein [Gallionellaceae bacterium]|nr:glycosyltransferase family 2 protein [Gallionellaceae bacterium]
MKTVENGSARLETEVINDPFHLASVKKRVAIVMATYNGGRFVEEQIRSIQAQSYQAWVLYVRDDGSRDDTVQKVLKIGLEDHRIKLVRDELGSQGAKGNFSSLMKVALEDGADYLFLADQDDVWLPEKLAIMLGVMYKLETNSDESTPLLVHCDLMVVNDELELTANSFVNLSRLTPGTAELGVFLCQNQVTGCACLINRALLELTVPVPNSVIMHDWWCALLASAVGKIEFIPKPLVIYRQHGGNVIGAMSLGEKVRLLLHSPKQWKFRMEIVRRSFMQATMLEERIYARGGVLQVGILSQINSYSHILDLSPLKRVHCLNAQKIGKQEILARCFFNLLITLMRKIEANSGA